jgi:hypothetical protein
LSLSSTAGSSSPWSSPAQKPRTCYPVPHLGFLVMNADGNDWLWLTEQLTESRTCWLHDCMIYSLLIDWIT